MITKYAHLSDDELLNICETKEASPIIGELVNRLKASASFAVGDGVNHRVECPVCEANLEVDYDEANGLFNLKVEK